MKKRFILLIDFSENSGNLIRYAFDWSRQINAELLLAHQTLVTASAIADKESKISLIKQANDEALKSLKELAGLILAPSEKVSFAVSEIPLQMTLSRLLDEPFENLIFVGLKGTSILKQIFIGSLAVHIIDNTKNIVIAMPSELTHFSHEKIFVAVTETHPLNLLELNKFLSFLDKNSTTITFFYLAKPFEKTKEIEKLLKNLSEFFEDKFKTNYAIYKGNDSYENIKEVINNKIEELLIVQKGSRLLTDQFFRKFLINELVYEGQTPLVVLP
jgi:hypothetical protein